MSSQNKKYSFSVDSATSPHKSISYDKGILTSPVRITDTASEEALNKVHQAALIQRENIVREEMAKHFANEITNLDTKYKTEKSSMEAELTAVVQTITNNLAQKNREVNALKHAILTERAGVKLLLEQKTNLVKTYSEDTNKLLKTCQEELMLCQQKVITLSAELEERTKQVTSERESMAVVMKEWASEMKVLRDKQADSKKVLNQMTLKYQNAKKTANNYKEFAANNVSYWESENERLKRGYEKSLKKILNKIQNVQEV